MLRKPECEFELVNPKCVARLWRFSPLPSQGRGRVRIFLLGARPAKKLLTSILSPLRKGTGKLLPLLTYPRVFGVNKFSRIQNVVWIENLFQLIMHVTRDGTGRLWPPAFFCEANAVLARDHAAPRQHL